MDLLDEELLFIGEDEDNGAEDEFERQVAAAERQRRLQQQQGGGGDGGRSGKSRHGSSTTSGRHKGARRRPGSARVQGRVQVQRRPQSAHHPSHTTMQAIYGASVAPARGTGPGRSKGKQRPTTSSGRRPGSAGGARDGSAQRGARGKRVARSKARPRSALPRQSAPTVHGPSGARFANNGAFAGIASALHSTRRPASATARSVAATAAPGGGPGSPVHRGVSSQVRAATGLDRSAPTQQRPPQGSGTHSTGVSRKARPDSAHTVTYGLLENPHDVIAPRTQTRRRPWSAMAPRTAVVVGSSSRGGTHKRAGRRTSGGFSSKAELRRAAAKRRQQQQEFQNALLAEEREQLQAAHARVTQANLWATSLGTGRNYRTTRVNHGEAGEPQVAGDMETRVIIHEPGGKSRDVSLEMFTREYEKLHQQVRRLSLMQAAETRAQGNGNGNGSPHRQVASPSRRSMSPVRSPGSGVARKGQRAGNRKGVIVGHYTHTLAGAMAQRKRRPNKQEVQAELRSVLKETAQLTQVLEQQLAELKTRGWNNLGEPSNVNNGGGVNRRRHSNDDLLVYTRR